MDWSLKEKLAERKVENRDKRKRIIILSIVAAVLALTIIYMTIFPAITMTPKPLCGLQEHKHTAECYEKILICGHEETYGHKHTAACRATATDLASETDLASGTDLATDTDGKVLICGKEECEPHIHNEACYETRLICTIPEHVHTDECYDEKLQSGDVKRIYEDSSMSVTVILPNESGIPAAAQLLVTPITEQSNREQYDSLVSAAAGNLSTNNAISSILFYDIRFVLDGEELEPTGGATKVSIRFTKPVFTPEDIEKASSLKVLHFDDNENKIEDVTDVVNVGEQGLSAVEFSTDSFSVYAIVLEDTTVTGNYYRRVESITDISASYIIVSAQGDHALTSGVSGYSTKLTITPIKGNPDYFTVKNSGGTNASGIANVNWQFSAAVNASGSANIRLTSNTNSRLNLNSNTIVGNPSTNTTAAYSSTTECWTLKYNNYYLYMSTPGTFARSNATDNVQYRNIKIFKLENTTLTIPGDVIEDVTQGTGIENPTKPNYPSYVTTSAATTGAFSTNSRTVVTAVADPATSQLESSFDNNRADDGKVLTDKSVIYRHDDYDAFDSYADGTFGVTLSNLAQEFKVKLDVLEQTPVDIVFVLDLSGSMTNSRVASGEYRAEAMVEAVNLAMNDLYKTNPNNRAAIVGFSSDTWDILPMGRYYVGASNATPNYNSNYQYLTYTSSGKTMVTNSNLRNESTRAAVTQFSISGNYWCGTFTQGGLARGMEMFNSVTDTTYTTPSGHVVNRTPVYIFLSDGDPTHCTSNYEDPLNGPFYGDGVAVNNNNGVNNNQGIQGFYTILTANYCKRMTSIHYAQPARIYTIGLGINATGIADMSGVSDTGDHYKRAVLDPTAGNIAALYNTSAESYAISSHQLKALLEGTYTGNRYITLGTTDYAEVVSAMGRPNNQIPVLDNPYTSYSYSDRGTFDDFSSEQLDALYLSIISEICTVEDYGYVLRERTSVLMYDYIGEGMELKSEPILRYGGVNYIKTSSTTSTAGGVTTVSYVYDYDFTDPYFDSTVDLTTITVNVLTDAAGNQTVNFFVPDDSIPVYSPVYTDEFYYEELPARLIYQVGIKDSALEAATDGDVFYTNRWQNGVSCVATMIPTSENPYYANTAYTETVRQKSENPTATAANSFSTHLDSNGLTHYLGNNGKLTVSRPTLMTLTVVKEWQEHDGTVITDSIMLGQLPPVTYKLYQSTQQGTVGTLVDTVTSDGTQNWSYTWTALQRYDENDGMYYYYVTEESVEGFEATYINNVGLSSNGQIKVVNRETGIMVAAQKIWTDAAGQTISGSQLNSMPEITARLYRTTDSDSGIASRVSSMILNNTNGWSYVWVNLPYQDSNGEIYYYYVVEDEVEGYTPTYSADLNGRSGIVTITNTPTTTPETGNGDIAVNKLWKDYNGDPIEVTDNMPPVTVNLYRRSGYLNEHTVTLSFGSSSQTQTVASGSTIVFSISAQYNSGGWWWNYYNDAVDARFYASVNGGSQTEIASSYSGTTRSATYTLDNITQDRNIVVTSQNKTPINTSVSVSSITEGTGAGSMAWNQEPTFIGAVTLNLRNNWTHTFGDLPSTETVNDVQYYYYYYLAETPVTGYETTYSPNNVLTATQDNHGIRDGTIEVINTSKSLVPEIPATGGRGTLMYVVTGCTLMLTACGMLLYKFGFGRRSRRNYKT